MYVCVCVSGVFWGGCVSNPRREISYSIVSEIAYLVFCSQTLAQRSIETGTNRLKGHIIRTLQIEYVLSIYIINGNISINISVASSECQ